MRVLIVCLFVMASITAQAAPVNAPENLDAWRSWVLKDQEFRACPLIAGTQAGAATDFACLWPGTLEIAADAQGASLSQQWHVDIDGWVPLPGSHQHWPQQVTVDGKQTPVVERNGVPTAWMQAGDHQLRARLIWSERPQTLQVPEEIALVSLIADGKQVAPLQRAGNQLTLGRGKTVAVEADSIDLRVFRKFTDDIPGELTTQVRIYASGQAREEIFGPALPDGFIAMALISQQWPARLDDEGMLHVQVQPGSNTVTLTARAAAPVDTLVARLPEAWAVQEIWSYESVPALRVTTISGAVQVDPRQADVPGEWSNLPAYAMNDGESLSIEQRSRGLDADVANRLNLQREAWFDFSGAGWFAKDHITGEMLNGWRFDLAEPFELQRAQAGNNSDDALLVTRGIEPGTSGVEWRNSRVDLNAGVRVDSAQGTLPVSGWTETFDQVTTSLHLPYGYRLIAAPGSDRASGSWMSRWSLLDVFLVAIIVLVAARLLGWVGAALSATFLLLGYQESGSPLWTLLAVIALALIARLLPQGRLSRVAGMVRIGAVVLLLIVALPFAAGQLRQALYPQLESSGGYGQLGGFADVTGNSSYAPMIQQEPAEYAMESDAMERAAPPPPPPAPSAPAVEEANRDQIGSLASVMPARKQVKLNNRYSQSTVVQTGAGEPGWQLGNHYQLQWSGPVLPEQEVRLLIASPWLVRLLRVAMIVVLGLLLWRLLRDMRWRWHPMASTTAKAGMILLCVSLAAVPAVHAEEFPPAELLEQLKARLLEPPACAPQCASIANAQVSIANDGLRVSLEVHALDHVAVPIPGDIKSLDMQSISIDAVASDAVLSRGGSAWIALDRGVHQIEIKFGVLGDRIELAFPMPPERIESSGEGWQVSGIADDRLITETLNLARARAATEAGPATTEQRFPPYVRVNRTLNLELEWSVDATVQRLAPREGGFTISLPTIAGEHVSTPGLKVRDGELTVGLADREQQTSWSSTLDQTDNLSLVAPDLDGHAEVWQIVVGPTWHLEHSGVPESASASGAAEDGFHVFEFHPLPGETLDLKISKPVAVEGATRAIDSLNLGSDFGERARTYNLSFDLRASQGGEQVITLPVDSELLGVTRDGEIIGARALDGKLSLPVKPGTQKYIVSFRENAELGTKISTPEVALGLPAANISLVINLPKDRWLLAAFGPPVGPAVLFWGELLVAIVLAWLLSRWRKSHLRFHHWLLLVLGFSTFSWLALLVVVAWLFALEWRARNTIEPNWKFNLAQLGLAVLSLVALICLFESIRNGLLGSPDMVVSGNSSSSNYLQWFADRSGDALPSASVISLPLWTYNLAMLAWALWLAWAVVGWLRNGFAAWMSDGYWRSWRVAAAEPAIDLPPPMPPAPPPA